MTYSTAQRHGPTAIVGMACRMPGGVRDIPGLWEFLREQKDVQMKFSEPRFSAEGFYHPDLDRPGTAVAGSGYVLEEDPRLFDPAFFGITDIEAETMDASQRKLLEVTYEAFENAGETWESVSGSRTGVFVGDIAFDNYISQTRDWDYSGKYSATGSFPNMLANRIHYVFNLKGPSVLLNSACTSAMYALHTAIISMRNGDCDSAIVAGSNWIMDPNSHIAMGKLGALSATSRSHTFDESADGYARGEGFAAIYLKWPSDAIRDGSPIRALIMGTAVNANGRTTGITNPSGAAQEIVIREAYNNAGGLDPSQTMLLECHGTGTRVGDPIEVEAAGNVFGPDRSDSYQDRLVVSSVKTNVGHLEGACAFPGILKVVSAIEAGEIPPILGFNSPNKRIDFDKAKARVVTSVEPWPADKLKRASVTSAGFGGTNGHCIIDHVNNYIPSYVKPGVIQESAKPVDAANGLNGHAGNGTNGHASSSNGTDGENGHNNNGFNISTHTSNGDSHLRKHLSEHTDVARTWRKFIKADAATRQLVVLPFSANSQASLLANVDALSKVAHKHSLADVAYTLSAKRSRFSHRTYAVVDKSRAREPGLELSEETKTFFSPQALRVGFVFTGQGAQWHAMGAELFEYGIFRETISFLDLVLAALPHPAAWKISDILAGSCESELIQEPAVSQTLCTALQIGLVDLLESWAIRPVGVVGHSSGEMAAAYAAGKLSAAEAITAAYYRGYTVNLNRNKGAMLAVGLNPAQGLESLQKAGLEGQVNVAAINSPESITMSGDADAIQTLHATFDQQGVFNRVLRTGGLAYHSHHMLALGEEYSKVLEAGLQSLEKAKLTMTDHKYPSVPWISSVIPTKDMAASKEAPKPSYWRANLESAVQFNDAVSTLLSLEELSIGAMVEVGPHPALKSPVSQIVKMLGKAVPHIATLKRGEDAQKSMLQLAGSLFALDAEVDLVAVNSVEAEDHQGVLGLAHGCTAVDLPPYQYTYGPIKYNESRLSKEYRLRQVPRHDLLGSRVPGTTRLRPQWRNIVRLKSLPWLDDHRVAPHVLHPGAAHIVMAMVAAEQGYNELPDALPIVGMLLRNVSIKKTLVVPEDDYGVELILSMEFDDTATGKLPGWATFSIASVVRDTQQWTEHCSGSVKVEVSDAYHSVPIETQDMDGRLVDAEDWYTRFADMGLQFGPSFQGYSEIRADPNKNIASARLALKTTTGMFPGGESRYPIHPASLDLAIRLGIMACNGGQAETASVQLPIHFDQMHFKYNRLEGLDWATGVSRGELRGLRGAYAQIQVLGEGGDVILNVDNMRFTNLNNDQQASTNNPQSRNKSFSSPFARLVWRPDVRSMSKEQWRALLTLGEESTKSTLPCLSKIFDLLGHARPDIRVAEVNAKEDKGVAEKILNTLTGPNGIKRYKEYTLADSSQDALEALQAATSGSSDVSYSILDIAKDPKSQGWVNEPYDVVVLPITAQENDSETQSAVGNCKSLLRPGGYLLAIQDIQQVTGSERSWRDILSSSGFSISAEITMEEPDERDDRSVIMLCTVDPMEMTGNGNYTEEGAVHFLYGRNGEPALLRHLARAMQKRGLATKSIPLDEARDALPHNARVVAFLDGENLLFSADQNRISIFQHLAEATSSMVWITSSGIVKGRNPDGAFVAGLLRTLGTENPSGRFLSVDIDTDDFRVQDERELNELVRCLADQESSLQTGAHRSSVVEDASADEVNRELAWQGGFMWVSRIVPDAGLEDYAGTTAIPEDQNLHAVALGDQGPVRAAFGVPGILTSLYFRPYLELLQPLPKDAIEVEVKAVGLNWKDLGLCSGRFDQNNLSNEYCGLVSRKGSDVTEFEIGDLVYGLGKGHFGNYTRVPAALAQKLEPGTDPVQAATMPLVYMTAVYAFEHVARLRKGQKVLVQSASGGLGLAAVQLARAMNAEIFATVGTEEKARFLSEEMGVAADHIFSSRDTSELPRVASTLRNGGFDVILSTAQGDMLHESIKALAPLGSLIDVGRIDVTSSKTMALELFQKSATFTSFDLGIVVDHDVALGSDLMRTVDEHYRAGSIGPILPHTVSDVSNLDKTLLELSKGKHTGKMVVSYKDPSSVLKVYQPISHAQFNPKARYVLVGGLSGFGRSVVRWMVHRGALDIHVWSRSGAKNLSREAVALIDELKQQGVSVRTVACDVSDRDQAMRAMSEASSDRMVRGVFNFAVSYQDISFDKMTAEMFRQGMAAKVNGTRNLHDATVEIGLQLDFFVMTSSLGTMYAFPTQSTYLAANNYMDYFARYRQRLGLPATTVALGFINDVGSLTNDEVTVNVIARAKAQTVTTSQVLCMLEPAFAGVYDCKKQGQDQWLGQLQDPLSAANIVTGIDPAVLATMRRHEVNKSKKKYQESSSTPRWYKDARASLMLHALEDAWRARDGASNGLRNQNDAADQSPAAQLRRQFEASIASIPHQAGIDKNAMAKAVTLVVEAVVASVAAMLFIDTSAINPANTVADQGIDSLLAAEFRNWLHVSFGKSISMLDLMDRRTTINALSLGIVEDAVAA